MKASDRGNSRRRLLTNAGLGALLGAGKLVPGEWVRPVVDAVALPVHAQASPTEKPPPPSADPCSCSGLYCDPEAGLAISLENGTVRANSLGEGEGECGGDGTFSFAVGDEWIEGVIADDCSEITGGLCESDSPCNGNFDVTFTATEELCNVLCLVHGSPVVMADGRLKPVEHLTPGTRVMSFDETFGIVPTEVTLVVRDHPRNGHYLVNGELRITEDHPVLVSDGADSWWMPVQKLKAGMGIRGIDGLTRVNRIEYRTGKVMTTYVETASGSLIARGVRSYVVRSSYGSAEQVRLIQHSIGVDRRLADSGIPLA